MPIHLRVIQGQPRENPITFSHGQYVIGSGDECDLCLNSPWVDRQHCLLTVSDHTIHMIDLGSKNGTLVNGQRVMQHNLQPGDQVQIGPVVLELSEYHTVIPMPKSVLRRARI